MIKIEVDTIDKKMAQKIFFKISEIYILWNVM